MPRVTAFNQWTIWDDKRLAPKPLSVRLPIHVQARLFALEEMYPNKSRNDLLIDLLKVGLDAYEEAADQTSEPIETEEGKKYYVPLGARIDFQQLSNKHYIALEKEKGNPTPPPLYMIFMGEDE